MKACMFVAGPHQGDKARTRSIWLKDGRTLVGYICELDGKGAGYAYRKLGRDHWSRQRFATIKKCKEGLGAQL